MSSTAEPSERRGSCGTTGVTGDRFSGEKSSRSRWEVKQRGYKENTPPADELQRQEDQYQLELALELGRTTASQRDGTAMEDGRAPTAEGDVTTSVRWSCHRDVRTPSPQLEVPLTSHPPRASGYRGDFTMTGALPVGTTVPSRDDNSVKPQSSASVLAGGQTQSSFEGTESTRKSSISVGKRWNEMMSSFRNRRKRDEDSNQR
jgi:hypothetical protein